MWVFIVRCLVVNADRLEPYAHWCAAKLFNNLVNETHEKRTIVLSWRV